MRSADISFLILRLTMAIVMFPHGAQKALGWFGGPGISGTSKASAVTWAFRCRWSIWSSRWNFSARLALVLGVLTRLVALGLAIDMAAAAILVHAPNGFFMNFTGQQKGEGVEFFILLAGIGLALTIGGPAASPC